ncbi:ribonuclease P protein subunit p25-like protein [Physella acuta]|uniref:ribonuclease P protein subunit p25-like protein n=1 Tax=Physella acuta TaxID=109671 RepID=UPI0027DCCC28|nr:ribonuclease P protein subunit p25-like protein [Physella acuta]
MENYLKGESHAVYDPPSLSMDGAIEMKVTNGSKIRNLMGYAMSSIADNNVRHITWNGTGNAISKTISCAEIMKRKIKGLHQITQIGFLRVEDFWKPTVEGLDTLKVNTNIPAISILLSKDPLDTNNPSYQAPGATDVMWAGKTITPRERSSKNSAAVKELKAAASKPKRSRTMGKDGSKAKKAHSVKKTEEKTSKATG